VDRCQQEKRKTVNGEDIVWAFEALGFDQYSHLMKVYLQRYKDVMKMDKTGSTISTVTMGGYEMQAQPVQPQGEGGAYDVGGEGVSFNPGNL
jgi:hypothetical protein